MATSAQINSIVALYAGYFDRAPDPAGLQFWIAQIDAGRDFATIAADFAKGAEAQALYPFLTVPDVATASTFVTAVYQNLFGRAPDAEGLAFWTKVIQDKTVAVGDMIQSIINGAVTAPDSTVLANKQTVGLDFATKAGNTPGFTYDAAAATAAKAAMDGVTADAASVTTATAATDAFLGAVTNIGQTFALTTGIDDLTGTDARDTFDASYKINDAGTDIAVFGALDKINGGAGDDTLIIRNQEAGALTVPAGTLTSVENLTVQTAGGGAVDATAVAGFAGMKTVSIQTGTAAGDNINLDTKANVTSVSIKGGSADTDGAVTGLSVEDTNATVGTKDTLASVTLDGVADATATTTDVVDVDSNALTTLTVKNTAVGATVSAAAATRELTLNLDAVTGGVFTDATATAMKVGASGTKSTGLTVSSAAAETLAVDAAVELGLTYNGAATKTIDVNGAGKVTFNNALNNAALTAVDGADNTGGVIASVGTGVAFTGGTGKDTLTTAATTKASNLGDGDDTFVASVAAGTGGSIDGGAGTDTVSMTSANAATLSATAAFKDDIANFEKVSLGQTALGASDTVNLANLDDISYVVSAGTAAGTGAPETAVMTFEALKSGQAVTFAGLTVTASDDLTGAQVATAFAGSTIVAGSTLSGTFDAEYDATPPAVAGDKVTVVRDINGDDTTPVSAFYVQSGPPAQVAVTTIAPNGANAITAEAETYSLTLTSAFVASGQTITFADGATTYTFTAATDLSGPALINALVADWNLSSIAAAAAYTASIVGGAMVLMADVSAARSDLSIGGTGLTVADSFTFSKTNDGVTGLAAVAEVNIVDFNSMTSGQSVTVAGRTLTATDDLTNVEAANTFFGGVNTAKAAISGTLTGWAVTNPSASVDDLTFTNTTAGASNAVPLSVALAALPTVSGTDLVITDGNATSGGGNLTLSGLAAGATVELTGANAGSTTVNLASTTGTADVVNLKLNGAANLAAGVVNVANVDTIAIATTDSTADTTAVNNPTAASTITLNAAQATTVSVAGNHGVDFSGSTVTNVTTLDASGVVGATAAATAAANGVAGAVTFTTAVTDKAVTITTGNGNDVIYASSVGTTGTTAVAATITTGAGADVVFGGADADVINTGSENDTVVSSTGADSIKLGAGNDKYVLGTATHSVLATSDTIIDFSANTFGAGISGAVTAAGANGVAAASLTGDLIDLNAVMAGGVNSLAVLVTTNAADAQTFLQNTATASVGNTTTGIALDSSSNKLYIDLDSNGTVDSVITLTGVTAIDAAAFVF
jgi:hypothetical protein